MDRAPLEEVAPTPVLEDEPEDEAEDTTRPVTTDIASTHRDLPGSPNVTEARPDPRKQKISSLGVKDSRMKKPKRKKRNEIDDIFGL